MSHKKTNARVEKWRTMLSTGLFKDEKLKPRVRKGVPSSMRMIVWPQLVKLNQFRQKHKQIDYQQLCNKFSMSVSQIALDIPRTFPEEQDSKVLRRSMNNVLKAISIVHPHVGYCQGMNFLTLRLLQVLDDENSFWLLNYILEKDINLRNNFIAPQSVELNTYVLEKLMGEYCASLMNDFIERQIQFKPFVMKWFLTIFSGIFKQELFNRYFEVYLLQGWSIIYAIAITLLKLQQDRLKKSSMEECMYILTKQTQPIKDHDQFMEAVYSLNLNSEKINKLESQYREKLDEKTKNPTSIKKQKKQKNFIPQKEFCSSLTFEKKPEIDFEALYLLKKGD